MQQIVLNRFFVVWLAIAALAVSPAALRAAPENLLISVTFGKDLRAGRSVAEPSQSRLYQTRDRRDIQQLQVLEGYTAFISYSRSLPYPVISASAGFYGVQRLYGLEYRDLESGFTVSPRLDNGRLLLEISAQRERMSSRGAGVIDGSGLQTTVDGELGQWIQLSGQFEQVAGEGSDIVRSSGNGSRVDDNEIWVRVDRLD